MEYIFPEDINISKEAKDLIQWILVLDPEKRITLEKILNHDFFKLGNKIPKLLPPSTILIKPEVDDVYNYIPKVDENKIGDNNSYFDENKIINKTYIKQWVDYSYSSKFGLGYVLTNGNLGVFFIDKTKIILNKKSNKLNYIYIKEENEKYDEYDINNYPNEIENKVDALNYFNYYFENNDNIYLNLNLKKESEENKDNNNELIYVIYVKKWMRTRHAVIFCLNSGLIQYIFNDNSEIQICDLTKTLTYINRRRERFTYLLSIVETIPNKEIKIKFKYIKGLINFMKENKMNIYKFFYICDEINNKDDKKVMDKSNQKIEEKEEKWIKKYLYLIL